MSINPTNISQANAAPSYNPDIEVQSNDTNKSIFSGYDTDQDYIITVDEQKASITNKLENVWTSCIARFFKDNISYTQNDVRNVTLQVLFRINRALNYIEYCKKNNIDIFNNNENTGVEDADDQLINYTDNQGNEHVGCEEPKSSIVNQDNTRTTTYKDGSTYTRNQNYLLLSNTDKDENGNRYTINYDYNEDGSYTATFKYDNGSTSKGMINTNNKMCCYITPNGNYKFTAKQGETFNQTLKRMGITNPKDIAAVRRANPKATKRGAFTNESGDVYIPKFVIENMKRNGTYNETKLLSVEY